MLTADMVRARRRGKTLSVMVPSGETKARALQYARDYIAAAQSSVGLRRDDFNRACERINVRAKDRRLAAGFRKLVQDRCTFEEQPEIDAVTLRQDLFTHASAAWQQLQESETFDRSAIVAHAAAARGMAPEEIDRLLYADLRGAQRLLCFAPVDEHALFEQYVEAQQQAVLLRAERVIVEVRCANPAAYRRLFHRMKFLRLLHSISQTGHDGYRINIDGPCSIFRSTTKYGFQLALLLPLIKQCPHWALNADIRWPRTRGTLRFSCEGQQAPATDTGDFPIAEERPEVIQLQKKFEALDTPWKMSPATAVLSMPGIGVCIPDVCFTHSETNQNIYLEVLGFWSRSAVWKRVSLIEKGFSHPIIFAASDRLRVSEAALDDSHHAALYVFKGTLLPRHLLQKLDTLAERLKR